jgi:hypothetical protein
VRLALSMSLPVSAPEAPRGCAPLRPVRVATILVPRTLGKPEVRVAMGVLYAAFENTLARTT